MATKPKRQSTDLQEFSAAEITALAHLYRGEVYRSTIWRTRLDTTTNRSVVTLGVALSITFSTPEASPLPLILVMLFLSLEARRYRYFKVWRARARWIERHLFVPMLREGAYKSDAAWNKTAFRNAEFDTLLAEANSISDADRRREVMAHLQTILRDEGVLIQPYWRAIYRHSTAKVHGAGQHPTFEHHHYKWWMDP